jgi:hypothetical protein
VTEHHERTETMDARTAERLERLRNRATLYELAMTRGEECILVAYSRLKGRRDIFNLVTADHRVGPIMARTGADHIEFARRTADGATMGEWAIRFTGRTEREAIIAGELPYIGDETGR